MERRDSAYLFVTSTTDGTQTRRGLVPRLPPPPRVNYLIFSRSLSSNYNYTPPAKCVFRTRALSTRLFRTRT